MKKQAYSQSISDTVKAELSDLPTRVKILNWGENPNARGEKIVVGQRILKTLADPKFAYKRVALDYEHNTLPGTPEYQATTEPRAIAGYGDIEVVEGDGVYLANITYTDSGKDHAKDYEDVSASPVTLASSGEVIMIASVALCRNGAVDGIEFKQVALSAAIVEDLSALDITQTQTESSMEELKKIAQALGLNEDATVDQITDAINKMHTAQATAAEKQKVETTALSARLTALEKGQMLATAAQQGKVVGLSAEIIKSLSTDDLQKHIDGLQATVPLNAPVVPTVDTKPVITEEAKQIALNCGLDPLNVYDK